MYAQWLKDLTYNNASVAVPLENGGLGASLSYFHTAISMDLTALATLRGPSMPTAAWRPLAEPGWEMLVGWI